MGAYFNINKKVEGSFRTLEMDFTGFGARESICKITP